MKLLWTLQGETYCSAISRNNVKLYEVNNNTLNDVIYNNDLHDNVLLLLITSFVIIRNLYTKLKTIINIRCRFGRSIYYGLTFHINMTKIISEEQQKKKTV
jgi:hypothetical protein